MAMNECNHNRKKEQAHPIDCIQSSFKGLRVVYSEDILRSRALQ